MQKEGIKMSVMDLSIAQKIIEGAQKKSSELSANFCISIVDPRGDLIVFVREDGAPWRVRVKQQHLQHLCNLAVS